MTEMTQVHTRSFDAAGRGLGIAVFLLGVLLLVGVFGIAYRDLVAAADGSFLQRIYNLPVTLVFKGGLLLVMGVVASAIANKGIALYEASRTREA